MSIDRHLLGHANYLAKYVSNLAKQLFTSVNYGSLVINIKRYAKLVSGI